jgi:positive regulator of sigma E activity
MPLAAFLTASIGVAYLTRSEAASALSGFAALGAAFLALLLIERRGGSRSVVTRKL